MDRGYHVLVFPEGRLTEDGELQPFRRGIGLLAAGLNAPVVPVKLDGLFELRQRRQEKFVGIHAPPGKGLRYGWTRFAIRNRRRRGRNNDETGTGGCGFGKVAQHDEESPLRKGAARSDGGCVRVWGCYQDNPDGCATA